MDNDQVNCVQSNHQKKKGEEHILWDNRVKAGLSRTNLIDLVTAKLTEF